MSENDKVSWLAESLRLTAFTTAESDLTDLSGSWKAVVEDEPDAVESKPKEHLFQESGPFREATLTFRHLPQRIDWIMHLPGATQGAWDAIGSYVDEIPPFAKLMKRWLAATQGIRRLAFGAVLLDPTKDREEGYKKVSEYLPFTVDLDARNFMYQINRRRTSRRGSPDLEINRLSKWSCVERRTTHFLIGDPLAMNTDSPSLFAVRLEVDINTVPEYAGSIDPSSFADLFDECVELGSEIAEKGDIR
jgi:hypothetical protein